MGDHYLLNLYGCSYTILNDEFYLRGLLEDAAICSGATVIQIISKQFDPQGVTVLVLLAESHISIHTVKRNAARYFYLRGPKIGIDVIIEQVKSERHTLQRIAR